MLMKVWIDVWDVELADWSFRIGSAVAWWGKPSWAETRSHRFSPRPDWELDEIATPFSGDEAGRIGGGTQRLPRRDGVVTDIRMAYRSSDPDRPEVTFYASESTQLDPEVLPGLEFVGYVVTAEVQTPA